MNRAYIGFDKSFSDIDNGVCKTCNREVTYDEANADDELCRRTKPYCTAPLDEQVDWRASCLHASACAQRASSALKEACDAWLLLLQTTSQYPNWEEDPEAIRAKELRKVGEP